RKRSRCVLRSQPIDGWILDGREDSVRITGQQIPQHGEGRLTSRDNWLKRDHRLVHDSPQFVWGGLRTAQISNHELGQPREQSDGFSEILRLWLIEVEDDGDIAT